MTYSDGSRHHSKLRMRGRSSCDEAARRRGLQMGRFERSGLLGGGGLRSASKEGPTAIQSPASFLPVRLLHLHLAAIIATPAFAPSHRHGFVILARQHHWHEQADALRRQHLAPLGQKPLVGFPTGRMLRSRSYSPRGFTRLRCSRRATSQSIWSVSEYQVKPTMGTRLLRTRRTLAHCFHSQSTASSPSGP
ncbi:hypothetical protein GGR34_001526 [Microvirga flocculans]|uniref:Uncharacterized protein n=1 Tax=Microvirga flocculans TaxID=217168 RepID=A0A7W6IEF1_9HYPH|nr:hypothetical protein [Microvirga flocculans]